ncbi:MAG: peptidylprolyl isomerase [Betaproteobacteria bacterium]|nr:peptidylprolyl isomerase [Betaproteobacteria bacterium]
MHAKPLPRLAAALAGIAATAVALAQSPIDPVLVENASVQIRRSDYERELERLPAELRAGFASNERRVSDLLRRLLIERTLAAQARAEKLPEKPEYAGRLAAETEKLIAQFKVAEVERNAGAEFDARRASYEVRARELYVADRSKYVTPEQVSASHILFETKTRSKEEAEKLAREALAKVKAGADFNKLAREVSEDRSAKANNGQLGWFTRAEMDPAFADAAFALKQSGDLAAPVLSSFGWHVIRLEGRRPQAQKPFEEVRDQLMAEQRERYVNDQREAHVAKLRNDPTIRAHPEAIEALLVRVDHDLIRRKVEELAPGAMGGPAK